MRTTLLVLTACAAIAGCKKSDEGDAKASDTAAKAADDTANAPDTKDTAAAGDTGKPAADPTGESGPEPAASAGESKEDPAPATTGGTEADTGAATTGGVAEPIDPLIALMKEIKNKRTKDARALAALDEAEKAGAEPRALAEAANARAKALFASADRATKFYEWAADKDKTYADPVFNLARMAVMLGEIPMTKEHLTEVGKRKGGKKLLQQLDFDPTWDIVKDDPEVRELMK